jgi:hypothetical protein
MNQLIIIFYIFLVVIILQYLVHILDNNSPEGFSNYTLDGANGKYPKAQNDILVQDTYPIIPNNIISNNSAINIWQDYPIFQLGSYEQITNNIRFPDNPDEGTCMPASFCNAFYKNKSTGSNIVTPLPPVNDTCGTRVGYFNTNRGTFF